MLYDLSSLNNSCLVLLSKDTLLANVNLFVHAMLIDLFSLLSQQLKQ